MLDSARYRHRVCGPLGLNRGTWVTRASQLSPRREELVGPLQHVSGERAGPLPLRCLSAPHCSLKVYLQGWQRAQQTGTRGSPVLRAAEHFPPELRSSQPHLGFSHLNPKNRDPRGQSSSAGEKQTTSSTFHRKRRRSKANRAPSLGA